MTPTEIKSIMAQIGGGANKRLGQHFLIDPSALQTVVDAADISKGDRVLEIGPGLGVLTSALFDRGAEVVAIERDRRFVSYLQRFPSLKIFQGDAATMEWSDAIGNGSWKFVSNLPYAITSLALRKALWNMNPPKVVVALVQREVAERAVARDGKSSLLSLMVALASKEARIEKRVGRGAFFPAPKVESAILKIVPMTIDERKKRWGIDPEEIMKIAKVGFAHPRKLLSSNLDIEPSVLESVGVQPKARAEDLSANDWAKLTKKIIG